MSYSRVPLSRERIWWFGLLSTMGGEKDGGLVVLWDLDFGRERKRWGQLTPLLETQTDSDEWSNMRIGNGKMSS